MRQKSNSTPASSETLVRNIRRATRKHHAAEEKIRIVLDSLRGETSIAELCRREGIAESMYYSWSKEFLEAGKRRLAGDTARAATTDEVKQLRREAQDLKEVVANLDDPGVRRFSASLVFRKVFALGDVEPKFRSLLTVCDSHQRERTAV